LNVSEKNRRDNITYFFIATQTLVSETYSLPVFKGQRAAKAKTVALASTARPYSDIPLAKFPVARAFETHAGPFEKITASSVVQQQNLIEPGIYWCTRALLTNLHTTELSSIPSWQLTEK
jgi:hypothetical protein